MTTDLLGDPIPETPAMNAPLPWRVFCMDDYPTYFVARSLEEAKEAAANEWGDWNPELTEDAYELTDEALALERINVADEGEEPRFLTFRAYLDQLIAGGIGGPGFFASAE